MAVRESHDRRVGGGAEKLLTIEEAARRVQLPADDLEAMIRAGTLPAFRLGGSLLRVRLQDVDALRTQRSSQRKDSGLTVRRKVSFRDRILDFFYFNDFYVVAFLIILTLLALLFAI